MVVTSSENGDPSSRRAVNLEVDRYCRDWSLTKTQYHVESEVVDYSCARSEGFKNTQIAIKETQTKGEVLVKLTNSGALLC